MTPTYNQYCRSYPLIIAGDVSRTGRAKLPHSDSIWHQSSSILLAFLKALLLQHGFDNFLSRLEIAEYEPDVARGRVNTRDTRNKVTG